MKLKKAGVKNAEIIFMYMSITYYPKRSRATPRRGSTSLYKTDPIPIFGDYQ